MKILWINRTFFPDLSKKMKLPAAITGGWMYSAARNLLALEPSTKLAIATVHTGNNFESHEINGIQYYLVPEKTNKRYDSSLEGYWKKIKMDFQPDVIHVHGTEYPHSLPFVRACGSKGVVVSIQGLASVCERYFNAAIEEHELKKYTTLRDYVRRDTFFTQRKNMQARGLLEQELLREVSHVIGRTSWDKVHCWALNPSAQYHYNAETLREDFYSKRWNFESCEKFSIFLSQGQMPFKGLHQVIKALPLILRDFPQTKIYVAGADFFTNQGFRLRGYARYVHKLIEENNLSGKIQFLGNLSAQKMIETYTRSHIFVCPSSIENSPNSLAEAQILGVPCIASEVGGIPDMLRDGESGILYRFEETEMLASSVCRLFSDSDLAQKLSKVGRSIALQRHNQVKNAQDLHDIYQRIV